LKPCRCVLGGLDLTNKNAIPFLLCDDTADTQNQVKQLQDMVRENFALFLRCADGIDTFNERTLSQSGPGLVDRLNRLDVSCLKPLKKCLLQ
jgi:hypothetical protein